MHPAILDQTLATQAGVISRAQVIRAGGTSSDIARMVRRREWVRLLPGVYLDHTGDPTWLQRAWAGVLFHWPAALAGLSAIRATVGPGWRRHDDGAPIEIAVPQRRHVLAQSGYTIQRPHDFFARVQWNAAPPRIRIDHAGVDVAARQRDVFAVVGVLADLCQTRRTTPDRLLDVIAARGRVSRRDELNAVLRDISGGSCSVLEHGFLHRVELPHRLPRPERQRPHRSPLGRSLRDLDYPVGVVVELDGRLFHDTAGQRDRDLERDLVAAAEGAASVRLGWGQVFDRPCLTAGHLGRILRTAGWAGSPVPCGPGCALSATGVYDAPAASCTPVAPPRAAS